jgi:choline dehydrogenase-like flavoprotein
MPGSPDRHSRRASISLAALLQDQEKPQTFDVVIVGSGYGGSVAAARLAGAQFQPDGGGHRSLQVCVLERGEEYLPGEFPADPGELPRHVRIGNQAGGTVGGFHEGLFDLRLGPDVAALVANGLGGGSLINAGVMLAPRSADFPTPGPLAGLIQSLHQGGWFKSASELLGSQNNTIRNHGLFRDGEGNAHEGAVPAKTAALSALAGHRGSQYVPITVAMNTAANQAGIELPACTLCGDCLTGCNVGAKNSLDVNLLELAARAGVKIVTGATVLSIRRSRPAELPHGEKPLWVLRVVHTNPRLQDREIKHFHIRARKLILSAGTLGSTEILLRSRDESLAFSPRLGERFSCNGDNIAAVHRMAQPVNPSASPDTPVTDPGRAVGPTITAAITIPANDPARGARAPGSGPRGFLVQEFGVPAALSGFFAELVTTRHMLEQLPRTDRQFHGTREAEAIDPMAVDPEAMHRTLLVGVIGHDDAAGTLRLSNPTRPSQRPPQQGTLMIHWPEARHGRDLNASHAVLERLVAALPAEDPARPPSLVTNPMWRLIPDKLSTLVSQPRGPVLTVHPLGGCAIGVDANDGVVNEYGQVFNARAQAQSDDWEGSLVVLDGSVIGGSLGVNPSLTIAATALRAMEHLMTRWEFHRADAPAPPQPPGRVRRHLPLPPPGPATPTQVEVVERLSGPMRLHAGGSTPSPCVVELTLHYQATELARLSTRQIRELRVDPARSRLRVFDQAEWDGNELRFAPESTRAQQALLEASLQGRLRFLHREASSSLRRVLRTLPAWLANRGVRDSYQLVRDWLTSPAARAQKGLLRFSDVWSAASRAGEVRRFDYELEIGEVLRTRSREGGPRLTLTPGETILGHKRLTYTRRGNPWQQLSELTLTRMPRKPERAHNPVLTLDLRFMAAQGFPLARITDQQDQVRALADLASFGLYLLRVILNNHLWSFRKPDPPDPAGRREPRRLPGPIAGLAPPEITELRVGLIPGTEQPVVVRLTRYRMKPPGDVRHASLPPLVMLHGYSASGNTFTHESLAPSAAEFFCRAGREVWVVDLRTSTGLPTATMHWALEEPALVDIPAALLHIRTVSGRPVDVLAHCIGGAMLSMALLTDARDIRNNTMQLGADTWISDEQLGTLTAFNGPAPSGGPHPCIRRVVLSQKGPVLRYPDANVFRSFLLSKIRRLVLPPDYRFEPPPNPGVASQLLDRLLSSLPYPPHDFDVDNPFPAIWKSTPWTASRHRIDLLYGRVFRAANLSEATLEHIDDLFGPMNVDTLAQIIHFARFDAITNQRGRGEFVTRGKLRDRWSGIPTLAIHGQENGLVDAATQDLLLRTLVDAGVPLRVSPSDQPPYNQLGHQDCMIGVDARAVFEDIEGFLGSTEDSVRVTLPTANASVTLNAPANPVSPPPYLFTLPWVGPRIDLPESGPNGSTPFRIAALSEPDQGPAMLALVPVWRHQQGGTVSFTAVQTQPFESAKDISSRWLRVEFQTNLPAAWACPADPGCRGGEPGLLAVIVHSRDAASTPGTGTAPTPPNFPLMAMAGAGMAAQAAVAVNANPAADPLSAPLAEWIAQMPPEDLTSGFLRLSDLERALRLHEATAPQALCFAVGSCQYPPGLFDRPVAQASMNRLAASVDEPCSPDLVLLLGDQIYADVTGGLADATRIDERFEQPHDDALRMAPLRDLMRRRPVRTLIDDHELSDNWEPLATAVAQRRPEEAQRRELTRRAGREAFLHYQRMRQAGGPRGAGTAAPAPIDQAFDFAGHPFFLLDTRTGRSARGASTLPQDRQIIAEDQWWALRCWLTARRDALKFVATPSVLLPRRRRTADDPAACGQSDAWDGFPESLARLIGFLYDERVTNTVFLSGDEHHSFHAETLVTRDGCGHALRILSIHSSALYAPFPFANGRQQQFPGYEPIKDIYRVGNYQLEVSVSFAPPGDGYALIDVPASSATPRTIGLRYLKGRHDGPQACVNPDRIVLRLD